MEATTLGSHVAVYARYSSSRQNERSIEDQVSRCREYIAQRGGAAEAIEVFTDFAVSGTSMARRGFEDLMRAVDDRKVSAIVTEDISRISRDFADAAQIFKRLQYAQVPLIGVADGIDTSARHAKLTYTLKSLVADLYIDDLRDKTLRGLVGRARAGLATGQVPFGYRTTPITDKRGDISGHEIMIDAKTKRVVLRIFEEYAAGRSMSTIVRTLNREGVDSPRVGTRHQFAGWGVTTLHSMLRNERYIGVWRFRTTEWVKVPGTNKRRPRARPASEVIVTQRPDMAFVPLPLWAAVHQRLSLNHGSNGNRTRHLLSGFLVCARCEAPLTMHGSGPTNTYYCCSTYKVKGTCGNGASLRAKAVRAEMFAVIRSSLLGSDELRKALDRQTSEHDLEPRIEEVEHRLRTTELQIKRIIACVKDGDSFEYLRLAMEKLELTARSHKAQLQELRASAKRPLRKALAKDVAAAVDMVANANGEEVEHAKERLRRWLDGGLMRFDGKNVNVALSPTAIVADVARRGKATAAAPPGPKLQICVPAEQHVPPRRERAPRRSDRSTQHVTIATDLRVRKRS